ncbi:MAG: BatA domain-containing protein [Rhodopirellula sp.]|nr:BatA domain-containing protein [Rhodopirellula sp.]
MSFLSMAFLAALPLAAAPILLHLFDRRRNVVIEWGAMQFLMEAATRRTSARKLKQWILLLLRVLAVAALVLSLAQPMLPGNWFGNTERGETIFVIDNSMSMLRTTGEMSLFDAALEHAAEVVQDVPAGDSLRILLASPYPTWAMGGSMRVDSGFREVIKDDMRELQPTHGRSDLLSALFTAVQAEIAPTQHKRRIVLLTDGQGSDWSIADDAGWKRFRELLAAAPIPTQLDVVELDKSSKPVSNLAVNNIYASRTVIGVNKSFSLTAQVQNYGRVTAAPCSVTWTIDGAEEHDSQVPSLDGGQVHDVAWKYSFAETGVYALSCAIDSKDELAPDNEATVVVEVVNEVPIILVESAPDLAEMQRDAFFVQAALGWLDGESLDERGVHAPTLMEPARLERTDLQKYRAIVVPNLTVLSEDIVARLHDYVSAGGGLWIGLGPRADIEAFNQHFFADGDGLSPLAIDRIVDEASPQTDTEGQSQTTRIDPLLKEHPATAELADTDRLDTSDITVSRRFRFVPPPEGEEVSVLLGLTNGEPLAVEKFVGRGRVIVQSIPLRLQWSELARSQAFVVMVQDWLSYLTQPQATRHNLSPGDPLSVHLADNSNREATLHTPHGDSIELTADSAGDGVVFRSSRTILPGNYKLEIGTAGDGIPFHVNRDPSESDLTSLTTADRQLLAKISGFSRTTGTNTISVTNQTDPLWPMLLMVLVGLIAAELLLSGIISRERFGSDPIAETTELWSEQQTGFPADFGRKSSPASTVSPASQRRAAEPVPHQTTMN